MPRSSYLFGCEVSVKKTGCRSRLLVASASSCTGTARYAHNNVPTADACTEQVDSCARFVASPLPAYGPASPRLHKGSLQQARQVSRLERGALAKHARLYAQHRSRTRCMRLQALRQRKEGPSRLLKELHNDVKRQLIYRPGIRHFINAVYLQSKC